MCRLLGDSMVELGLDPYLLHTESLVIRWYAVMIVAGIVVGGLLSLREARRRLLSGDVVLNLAVLGVCFGILGARLFHVLDYLSLYAANPLRILAFQEGGLSVYGGLLCGIAAGLIYLRLRGLPAAHYLDAVAPGLVLGLVTGRVGNLINGDAWGKETGGSWGLVYTNPDSLIPASLFGYPSHPVPLYEIAGGLIIFIVLWKMRGRLVQPGTLFLVFMILYALMRFATGFFRENNLAFLDLNQSQLIALIALILSIPFLVLQQEEKKHGPSINAVR